MIDYVCSDKGRQGSPICCRLKSSVPREKVLASVFSDCQRQVPLPIAKARKLGKVAGAGDHVYSNGIPLLAQIC